MNKSKNGHYIYCHKCYKWLDKCTEILIIGEEVFCIFCYHNNNQTLLGYDWEW